MATVFDNSYIGQEPVVPLSLFSDAPLRLSPEAHPNGFYSEQHGLYNRWWSYYKGYVLHKKNDDNVELYPVKLNLIRSAVINHAAVLLGQFGDDSIVQFGVKNTPVIKDDVRQKIIEVSNLLWAVNDGDDGVLEQALFQQVLGGCFYKVAWMPTRKKWPIRYVVVDPRACFPIWDDDDPNRLVSIEVSHQIPRATAATRYRVPIDITSDDSEQFVTVHERWTEAEYSVTVDGSIGVWPDGSKMEGKNPFIDPVMGHAIVPFVYIPRIRVGDWWGESLVPSIAGAQDEINNNLGLLGDAVAEAVHQPIVLKNRTKGTQGLNNRRRNEILDLGMAQPGQSEPDLNRIGGVDISAPMKEFVTDDLLSMAREANSMPDVAYGKTDASIRSALTLKYMMWPAINVGLHYRKHFSTGLKMLTYYAFVIAYSKRQFTNQSLNGVGSIGVDPVTPDMIEGVLIGHKTHWPPMLPDDRAEMVNEMVQRLTAGIISPETAVRRLDGSDELEEEMNRIDEHRQKLADEEAEKAEMAHQKNIELTKAKESASDDKKPKDQTNKAQASGGRKSSPSE